MAAIAYPREATTTVPTLRLVPTGAALRPSAITYRRRRSVAALLAALLVVAVALAVAGLVSQLTADTTTTLRAGTATGTVLVPDPAAYGAAGDPLPARAVYVVQPGDTLWSIARAVAPGADVTETAARLADLNGSSALQVGQRLRLN